MAKTFNRIELKLSDFVADFEECAIRLARQDKIPMIREVQAIPYEAASPGKVVLQFSLKHPGRLLVGHNPIDWEWANKLVATRPQLKIKKLENHARRN